MSNLTIFRQNGNKVDIPLEDLSTPEKLSLKHRLGMFNYDFLPRTAADEAQAVSADFMADAGVYSAVKAGATVAGGLLGGAPGAALGFFASTALTDSWNVYDKWTQDNGEFWNEFKSNISETYHEDNSFQDMLEGFSTDSSFVGRGGKQAIVKDWGGIIGNSTASSVGSILGTAGMYMGGFAMSGGASSMFAIPSVYEGINETTRATGMGEEWWSAAARGAVVGAAFYGSGTISAKVLPMAVNKFAKAGINKAVTSTMTTATHGVDAAIAAEADMAVLAATRGDMTYEYDPIRSALAFGLGTSMSGVAGLSKAAKYVKTKVKARKHKNAVIDNVMEINTEGADILTRREAKGIVNDLVRTNNTGNGVLSRLAGVEQPYRKEIAKDLLEGTLSAAGKNSPYNQKVVLDLIDSQNFGGGLKTMSQSINQTTKPAIRGDLDTRVLEDFNISKQAKKNAVEWARDQANPTESLRNVLNNAQKNTRGKRIGVYEVGKEIG